MVRFKPFGHKVDGLELVPLNGFAEGPPLAGGAELGSTTYSGSALTG